MTDGSPRISKRPLKQQLKLADVTAGIPGASIDGRYIAVTSSEEVNLPARLINTPDGWQLIGDSQRSNPKLLETVMRPDFLPGITQIIFNYQGSKGYPRIAILKIAYLHIFRLFGYSAIIRPQMQSVRQQIQNPTKKLLPDLWVVDWNLPDRALGVNIIWSPEKWRCFLVVFDLFSEQRKYRCGVVLPGPNNPGLGIYDQLNCKERPKVNIATIPVGDDLWLDPMFSFYSHEIWKIPFEN